MKRQTFLVSGMAAVAALSVGTQQAVGQQLQATTDNCPQPELTENGTVRLTRPDLEENPECRTTHFALQLQYPELEEGDHSFGIRQRDWPQGMQSISRNGSDSNHFQQNYAIDWQRVAMDIQQLEFEAPIRQARVCAEQATITTDNSEQGARQGRQMGRQIGRVASDVTGSQIFTRVGAEIGAAIGGNQGAQQTEERVTCLENKDIDQKAIEIVLEMRDASTVWR